MQCISLIGFCRWNNFINEIVPGCLHNGLFYVNFTAVCAITPLRQSRFGAGRRHGGGGNRFMPQCFQNSLCHQHLIANGAMFPLCQPSLGTGGRFCGVYDFVVLLGGVFLRFGIVTVFAIPLAGACRNAGCRGFHSPRAKIVIGNRNDLLRDQNGVTHGAMLARRQAGLCAGGGFCRVNDN